MDVEIKSMPALRVAAVSHVGSYEQIGEAFERLHASVAKSGLEQRPGSTLVAIYYDDPETVPEGKLRSEAAIVVPDNTALPKGLKQHEIERGRYACTTHIGPYEQLGDAWARFKGEWLRASGHHAAGHMNFELYRNTPATTPKDKLRTELYIPLLE